MAIVKRTIPTKKKKTNGIETGPSRTKKRPAKKDPFANIAELQAHDAGRRKIFRGK